MERVLFCIHNVNRAERERLEASGARAHDCLERCRRCFETPFVVVEDEKKNRTVLDGESHGEVLSKISTK
ncbi:MAG: hypothetical protein ACI89L_001216 [Phycisphaerales bacterium]|jgi:uncharacterized protein YuzB (UPF0349 family)